MAIIVPLILIVGIIITWNYLQTPVDKNSKKEIEVVVESGTNPGEIAKLLKEKDLIRNVAVFKLYLRLNKINNLKASKYQMTKAMSLKEIVEYLQTGVVSNEDAIKITFKDGERITEYAKEISTALEIEYDEVINTLNDKTYIEELIKTYWFLTDKIKEEGIYYPLEGYLAPETYYFEKDTTIKDVVKRLLDQTEKNLEEYKEQMTEDPHYYMTMASVVQLEGTNTENRKMIVGVFENRLKSGMSMGSDVTTYYALQESMKNDLTKEQFETINPYNTRGGDMIGKMPIGPICNPNKSSVEASINPLDNDYLFFVADKHGNIYYTKTNAEHVQKVAEIKANGDWIFD